MNSDLNLSSKPFNNRLLPWVLTLVILGMSLIGLILVVTLTTRTNTDSAAIQTDINRLKQKEQSLLKSAQEVKESLTPDQQQTLKAAHQLVDRKTFSWSRLFADLETSLPGTVRVSRIGIRNVTARAEGTVAELELGVFAKSPTTITDMISSMDKAGIFQAQLLSQNLQKGRGETGTEYELLVIYRPRAGFSAENVAKVEKQDTAEEQQK